MLVSRFLLPFEPFAVYRVRLRSITAMAPKRNAEMPPREGPASFQWDSVNVR